MKLRVNDFRLPDELEKYQEAVKAYVKTELEKIALQIEESNKLPPRLFTSLQEAGLLKLRLPREYGGIGLTLSQYLPILMEVGKSHGSIRLIVHGSNVIFLPIYHYGTKKQKQLLLSKWAKKGICVGFALTEPEGGTGVDIKTTAKKVGDVYRLNGSKHLISYADFVDSFLVPAYTGDRSLREKGISVLLVDKGTPGFTIEPHEEMIGIKGSFHGILHFDNCEVPAENLIGKEGEGLDIALRTLLDTSRLCIAASCIGPAERCLESATEYAKKRVTFGKSISERQAIQQMLADMATEIWAAKCMIADAARQYDDGKRVPVEASMCKLFASNMVMKVSDNALLVHGGVGYTKRFPLERHYRDARSLWLEEGTPTIQRLIIARDVLGKEVRSMGA